MMGTKKINYHCSQCHERIEISTHIATSNCRCPVCHFVEVPVSPRKKSLGAKAKQVAQAFVIVFAAVFVVGGLFSGILPLLLAAGLLLGILIIPVYLLSNLVVGWVYRHDERYQDYKRHGGNVFWDNFLGTLNRGPTYYTLPNPEPEYVDFVPPGHWKYQCLNCNARLGSAEGSCWNCNINLSPN